MTTPLLNMPNMNTTQVVYPSFIMSGSDPQYDPPQSFSTYSGGDGKDRTTLLADSAATTSTITPLDQPPPLHYRHKSQPQSSSNAPGTPMLAALGTGQSIVSIQPLPFSSPKRQTLNQHLQEQNGSAALHPSSTVPDPILLPGDVLHTSPSSPLDSERPSTSTLLGSLPQNSHLLSQTSLQQPLQYIPAVIESTRGRAMSFTTLSDLISPSALSLAHPTGHLQQQQQAPQSLQRANQSQQSSHLATSTLATSPHTHHRPPGTSATPTHHHHHPHVPVPLNLEAQIAAGSGTGAGIDNNNNNSNSTGFQTPPKPNTRSSTFHESHDHLAFATPYHSLQNSTIERQQSHLGDVAGIDPNTRSELFGGDSASNRSHFSHRDNPPPPAAATSSIVNLHHTTRPSSSSTILAQGIQPHSQPRPPIVISPDAFTQLNISQYPLQPTPFKVLHINHAHQPQQQQQQGALRRLPHFIQPLSTPQQPRQQQQQQQQQQLIGLPTVPPPPPPHNTHNHHHQQPIHQLSAHQLQHQTQPTHDPSPSPQPPPPPPPPLTTLPKTEPTICPPQLVSTPSLLPHPLPETVSFDQYLPFFGVKQNVFSITSQQATLPSTQFHPPAIDPIQLPVYTYTQMWNLLYTPLRLEAFLNFAMLYVLRDFLIHFFWFPQQIILFFWQLIQCCGHEIKRFEELGDSSNADTDDEEMYAFYNQYELIDQSQFTTLTTSLSSQRVQSRPTTGDSAANSIQTSAEDLVIDTGPDQPILLMKQILDVDTLSFQSSTFSAQSGQLDLESRSVSAINNINNPNSHPDTPNIVLDHSKTGVDRDMAENQDTSAELRSEKNEEQPDFLSSSTAPSPHTTSSTLFGNKASPLDHWALDEAGKDDNGLPYSETLTQSNFSSRSDRGGGDDVWQTPAKQDQQPTPEQFESHFESPSSPEYDIETENDFPESLLSFGSSKIPLQPSSSSSSSSFSVKQSEHPEVVSQLSPVPTQPPTTTTTTVTPQETFATPLKAAASISLPPVSPPVPKAGTRLSPTRSQPTLNLRSIPFHFTALFTLLSFLPQAIVCYVLIVHTSTSSLYHYIRSLSSMRLLAILGMAGILDKLMTTMGNDLTDWYFLLIDVLKAKYRESVIAQATQIARAIIKRRTNATDLMRQDDVTNNKKDSNGGDKPSKQLSPIAAHTTSAFLESFLPTFGSFYNHPDFHGLAPSTNHTQEKIQMADSQDQSGESQPHVPNTDLVVPPLFSSLRLLTLPFILYTFYLFFHSVFMLVQVTAIHIALNSTDGTFFVLITTVNFAELKTFVFKKYFFITLFQITVSDVAERAQFTLHTILVILTSIGYIGSTIFTDATESSAIFGDIFATPRTDSTATSLFGAFFGPFLANIFGDLYTATSSPSPSLNSVYLLVANIITWCGGAGKMLLILFTTKIALDWIKHIFMTKFNRLPSHYKLFSHLISRDIALGAYHPQHPLFQSSQRRFGIIYPPLVLLFYRIGYLFFWHPPQYYGSTGGFVSKIVGFFNPIANNNFITSFFSSVLAWISAILSNVMSAITSAGNSHISALSSSPLPPAIPSVEPSIVATALNSILPLISTFFSVFVHLFTSTQSIVSPVPDQTLNTTTTPTGISSASSLLFSSLSSQNTPQLNAFISRVSPVFKIAVILAILFLLYIALWVLHLALLSYSSRCLLEWNNGYYNTYQFLTPAKDDSSLAESCGVGPKDVTHPRYNVEQQLYQISQLNGSKGSEPPLMALYQQDKAERTSDKPIPGVNTSKQPIGSNAPSYMPILVQQQQQQKDSGGAGKKDQKDMYLDNTVRFGMYSNKIPL